MSIKDIQDMRIAQVEYYDHWGDEKDPNSDWYKLTTGAATFEHREACEFIVAIGSDSDDFSHIEDYQNNWKMSEVFLSYCRTAKELGYSYVCFYS